MTRSLTLIAASCLVALAGLMPIAIMAFKSIVVEGSWSAINYRGVFESPGIWRLAGNSLSLAGLATLLAAASGVPLAILFSRTDLPWRRLFAAVLTIPLLLPPYITAVAWFGVLSRRGLLFRHLDENVSQWTSQQLFGLHGCALTLASAFMPVVMLLTMGYLGAVNPRLEEAARLVAGWPGTLRRVSLPLVFPAIVLAVSLVFLLSLGELGAPMFLRYAVLPVETFTQFSAFFNFGAATASAAPLLLITVLMLGAERRALRNVPRALQPMFETEAEPISLGRWRIPLAALVALGCLAFVLLPYSLLLIQAGSGPAYLDAIRRAGDSMLRSALYATLGACVLMVVGFFTGYLVHTRCLAVWRAVDSLTVFLFAVPSTVLGIGLVILWNRPETNFIYATPAILLLGFLAQYIVVTTRASVSAFSQIPSSMEDAAQICGAGWLRRILLIVAPMARRGLAAGWIVAYIFCVRDLGVSMIAYPPGHDTLPVRTFTLMANGAPDLIAALCVLMVAITFVPVGLAALGGLQRGRIH